MTPLALPYVSYGSFEVNARYESGGRDVCNRWGVCGEAWTCTSRLWCVRDSVNDVTMGTNTAKKKPPDTEAILYFFTHEQSMEQSHMN